MTHRFTRTRVRRHRATRSGACAGFTLIEAVVALAVVAITLMPQMEFRPQLFTFVLFAAMLALLARHNYRGLAPLWLIIPMMALWANLHGGFTLGLMLCGAFVGTEALEPVGR